MRAAVMAACVLAAGTLGMVRADDKKADATGTWKWEVQFGDQKREQSAKLKQDGDKLTGTLTVRDMEVKIEDGTVKNGEVAFKVNRERNGMKFTSKYSGKLSGDSIKGSIEVEFGGETRKIDWDAKREKK